MLNCVLGLRLARLKYGKNSVYFVFTDWFVTFYTFFVQLGTVWVCSLVTAHESGGTCWMYACNKVL